MTRLDHHPKKPGKLGRAVPLLDSSNSPLILQKIRKPLASPQIFDPLFFPLRLLSAIHSDRPHLWGTIYE